MVSLLKRARNAWGGGAAEPPPEPIELTCVCGAKRGGVRLEVRQFLKCSTCGHTLFALPATPYPVPEPPRSKKTKVAPVQEDAVGEETGTAPPPAEDSGKRPPSPRHEPGPPRVPLARRWLTPGKLVAAGILVVITATGYLTVQLRGRQQLPQQIRQAERIWTDALAAGDFRTADETLQHAAALVRRFGSGTDEQNRIMQTAAEISIFAHLMADPLGELPDQLRGKSPEQRAEQFEVFFGKRAILLDVWLDPVQEADADSGLHEWPVSFAGSELVHLNVAGLDLFQDLLPSLPRRVIFGARVADLEPIEGGWILNFESDSGVLITEAEYLRQVGWDVDQELETLVETQK